VAGNHGQSRNWKGMEAGYGGHAAHGEEEAAEVGAAVERGHAAEDGRAGLRYRSMNHMIMPETKICTIGLKRKKSIWCEIMVEAVLTTEVAGGLSHDGV
jgi:hypothetical protein